jgi:hypothetical protein
MDNQIAYFPLCQLLGSKVTGQYGQHIGTLENLVMNAMGNLTYAIVNCEILSGEQKRIILPYYMLTKKQRGKLLYFSLGLHCNLLHLLPRLTDNKFPADIARLMQQFNNISTASKCL